MNHADFISHLVDPRGLRIIKCPPAVNEDGEPAVVAEPLSKPLPEGTKPLHIAAPHEEVVKINGVGAVVDSSTHRSDA
jgi:hypothetical protein